MVWNPKESAVIRRERLRLAAPDAVYQELRDYADYLANAGRYEYDEALEEMLLRRGDKLVNLALAQYAAKAEVVLSLYQAASTGTGDSEHDSAVRLAAISNCHTDGVFTAMFGIHVTPHVAALLERGDNAEMEALITNPQHRTLLKLLYQSEEPFDRLDDETRVRLVRYSARNPGLNINEDSEDGPDLRAWDIQKAVWVLVRSAPLTQHWATAVHQVLVSLDPYRTRSAGSLEDQSAEARGCREGPRHRREELHAGGSRPRAASHYTLARQRRNPARPHRPPPGRRRGRGGGHHRPLMGP